MLVVKEILKKHLCRLNVCHQITNFWLHATHIILQSHFKKLPDISSSLDTALMITTPWRASYLRYICAFNHNANSYHLWFFFSLSPSSLLLPLALSLSVPKFCPLCVKVVKVDRGKEIVITKDQLESKTCNILDVRKRQRQPCTHFLPHDYNHHFSQTHKLGS